MFACPKQTRTEFTNVVTHIRWQNAAATVFSNGKVYMMNRSSLWGSIEKAAINKNDERRKDLTRPSTIAPNGTSTRLVPRALGRTE